MTILNAAGMTGLFGMTVLTAAGTRGICEVRDFFEGVGIREGELGHGGPAQGFQVSSATETLAHVVGHRTHVRARGYTGAEADPVALDRENLEFLDLDLYGMQDYLFMLASQFVGWDAVNLLG